MFKVSILIVSFFLWLSPVYGFEFECFQINHVKISSLHPKLQVQENFLRRSEILIRTAVDCKTKEILKPSTFDEALKMLDVSLPLEYKAALVSNSLLTGHTNAYVYKNSTYGYSIGSDLFRYYHDTWSLDSKNNICLEQVSSAHNWEEEGCFWLLIDELSLRYQKGMDEIN